MATHSPTFATMASRNSDEKKSSQEAESNSNSNSQGTQKVQQKDYLIAAARLSTSRPLGAPKIDEYFDKVNFMHINGDPSRPIGKRPTPGVICIDYLPTFGRSNDLSSPLNRAANLDFNTIRAKISGNRPYEPVDALIYRACVDGLRDMYHKARRIYATVRGYSATNLYRPKDVLTAQGLEADSWIKNAAELYQWLMNTRNTLRPFPTVPLGTISDRHVLYNTAYFTDGEPESAQTYILNQVAFYSYEHVDEVKGATLVAFPATYDAFVQKWNDMYTALQNSSDVYVIAADIRRAFEDKVVTDLPDTPVDITPTYVKFDPVLNTIMNTTILGIKPSEYDKFKIYDSRNGNGVLCKPDSVHTYGMGQYGVASSCAKINHLNSVSLEPSSVEIESMVRMHPVIHILNYTGLDESNTFEGAILNVLAFATEVPVSARIVLRNSDGTSGANNIASLLVFENANDTSARIAASIVSDLSNFDWHPPVVYCQIINGADVTADDGVIVFAEILEDVQNYIPVHDDVFTQLFDAIVLNEFDV